MSYDLAFWSTQTALSDTEADAIYDRIADGESGFCEVWPEVSAFRSALLAKFPDLSEENMETSPWAAPVCVARDCVIVTMSGSRSVDMVPILTEMARNHGAVIYDPQIRRVLIPDTRTART